jgi:hypothetical protein
MSDIILIGCVSQKTTGPYHLQAQDLYTSPLFKKRRAYAERSGKPWFILSALHGLVPPERVLAPYDFTMAQHTARSRKEWALQVALDLYKVTAGTGDVNRLVEVHAGAAYTEPLHRPLAAASFTMLTPLKGMKIGEQLAWYGRG